jgi:hypothetical protein
LFFQQLQIAVNNTHICEFYQREPMYLAQLVEVKGDINLESVQVYPGSGSTSFPSAMGGDMGYCPPPPSQPSFGGDMGYCPPPPSQPSFGGDMGYCPPPPSQPSFGGDMGYCPPPPSQPSFGGDMGYCPPPPPSQPAFGGDFNASFGFPSAPPQITLAPFAVCIMY